MLYLYYSESCEMPRPCDVEHMLFVKWIVMWNSWVVMRYDDVKYLTKCVMMPRAALQIGSALRNYFKNSNWPLIAPYYYSILES